MIWLPLTPLSYVFTSPWVDSFISSRLWPVPSVEEEPQTFQKKSPRCLLLSHQRGKNRRKSFCLILIVIFFLFQKKSLLYLLLSHQRGKNRKNRTKKEKCWSINSFREEQRDKMKVFRSEWSCSSVSIRFQTYIYAQNRQRKSLFAASRFWLQNPERKE